MTRVARYCAGIAMAVMMPAVVYAAPLRLPEVLRSVEATHPKLEGARAKVDKADGKAFAARGGFDPKLSVKSKWTPVGYYENLLFDASVEQDTPIWGASVYAGYRAGWGEFPVYKGDLETRAGGELRAGLEVPIWRDGPIDERRAKVKQTKAERADAEAGVDTERLEVLRKAANTYWKWVEAGLRLDVAEGLLELAMKRQSAIEGRVSAGAAEPILIDDNRRLVLGRTRKVVEARRKFDSASVALSLFYRDDELRPRRPSRARLPGELPQPPFVAADEVGGDVEAAWTRRPEIMQLEARREAADVAVRLAKNQRGPEAALQTFIARDLGPTGPTELVPLDWGLGLVVSIPIPLRKARGELMAAKADVSILGAEQRAIRDEVEAEVRTAHVSLDASRRAWKLAQEQVGVAMLLAEAERTKLREGASDLVIVNLRELSAADAQNGEIEALSAVHQRYADYLAATGRTPLDG